VCRGQRRHDLVPHRDGRALARRSVRDELHDAQRRPGLEICGDRDPADVGAALGRDLGSVRALDDVIHARGQPDLAQLRRVNQHDPGRVVERLLGGEGRIDDVR
jgi:hypothetical protein